MVDRNDLPKVNQLLAEQGTISEFINLMSEPGFHIISMTGAKPSDTQPTFWQFTVSINTDYMTFPQQMVTAIQDFLDQRYNEITQELEGLGVSGLMSR